MFSCGTEPNSIPRRNKNGRAGAILRPLFLTDEWAIMGKMPGIPGPKGDSIMIFYFSGTGNSCWAAQTLAESLGDTAKSILDGTVSDLTGEVRVGLVFPIYAWGVPEPMLDFVKKLPKTDAFTFGLCTCGADAGQAMKKLSKIFHLDSSYSLAMPNNYVVGSELDAPEEVREKLAAARKSLETIAGEIGRRQRVYRVEEGKLAFLKSNFINKGFNGYARSTKPFFVTDRCVGCGQCAALCPAKTITMTDGKPRWGDKCYQCMACINRCPQTAIEYGESTKNRRRYCIEQYL